MKKILAILIALAALALSGTASAGDCNGGLSIITGSCNQVEDNSVTANGGSVRDNVVTSSSSIDDVKAYGGSAYQGQGQKQDQDQDQDQHQAQIGINGQKQSNNSSGNEVSFTQNYEAAKYAPDAFAPSTAPCTIGIGGSFGNSVFSGGLTTGYTDETCRDLEVVRAGTNSTDPEMRDGAKKLYNLVLNERLRRYDDNATPAEVSTANGR